MTISVVIHTYNSEKYLEDCLESVKQADEIVLCDMYSNDRTIEIAQKHGCKIVYHENVGFADPARNFAISNATSDWILVVDSDEMISKELWEYLREHTKKENPSEGLEIPRKNILVGRLLWSWYPNTIQRFWKKGCVHWPDNVHETPDTYGRIEKIDPKRSELAIIHYNYDSIEAFVGRMNKYTTLELKKHAERGNKFSIPYMLTRPAYEFIKKYFLKQGYKDGMQGFIFSVMAAIYEFVDCAKLWECEYKSKNPNIKY